MILPTLSGAHGGNSFSPSHHCYSYSKVKCRSYFDKFWLLFLFVWFSIQRWQLNVVQSFHGVRLKTTHIMHAVFFDVINLLPNEGTWRFICRLFFVRPYFHCTSAHFGRRFLWLDSVHFFLLISLLSQRTFVYLNMVYAWNGASANLTT